MKAFKIQTRLNATTIAQDEAKKADQVEAVERSAAVLHEFQGGAIDGGGDGGLLLKNLDLDLFREKLLDKLGADWGRPTPELLQAQTTAEEAKAKHQARQAKGALETRMLEPVTPPFSAWPSEVRVAIETGVFEPTTAWRDLTSHPSRTPTLRPRRSSRWVGIPFRRPCQILPDLTGIPMPKAGGCGAPREGPDRPPTIPPASGSGATSSGAEGPDKPSAVGLDTKDPEVQLSVLRWMMTKRAGEVRIFAGRWVRRPGPVHVPDWARNLTKVNPEALEKGTHPRNQVGGLPWARYSSHTSWGCSGTALWGVWEALPLLQPRQRGPKNKAQNQTRLEGWETLKEDARCFLKEEGLPFPQTGPEFLTDTPAEVMQLPAQGADDPAGGMRRAHLGPGGEPLAVLRGVQWTALEARGPWRR